VDDLLELSRAEAGQLAVSTRSVDVAALLHEAVEEHRASARAAGHQLDLTITHEVLVIVTDPARVSQVLGNLLSNAVKYTPHGGRIAVRAEQRARDGGPRVPRWIAVDVVDNGPGIPEEQMETIFDEFARLARHADKPGSGLGLSIARRIAALLGGEITVCAEPPQGTRFTLWLPAGGQPTLAHVPVTER
jgi:two-component system sensor histidine kinase BaeS